MRSVGHKIRCRSPFPTWLARAAVALAGLLVSLPATAQNITGTVYRDVDANATLDPASPAEAGVAGITLTV
ncbi:MAG: hypothetical protein AAF657_28945, partial [Acidobacteriota bacterium]